jgi:hypothetical protein
MVWEFLRGTPEQASELPPIREVPVLLDKLPDGREVVIHGDVPRLADHVHRQGENDRGFRGTCGLCSIEGILKQFGFDVSENKIVDYAADHGLCETHGPPEACGGTTLFDQVLLLRDFGVGAFVDVGDSLERLASRVEEGRGVIAEVNAGVLWDRAEYYGEGQANHAIVITGTARDPKTNQLLGFFINDSGVPSAGRFVDAQTMQWAFVEAGGLSVCTDAAPNTGERIPPEPVGLRHLSPTLQF